MPVAASLMAAALLIQGCGRAERETPYTGPSLVQHVNADTFDEVIEQSTIPVAVDFWAPWCGPCRMISPILDKLSVEFEGRLKVVKVNVDDNQALAETLRIEALPTILIFKEGRSTAGKVGAAREEEFRQWFTAQIVE